MTTATITPRIESLQNRIHATACRVFASQPITGLVEKEDIQQEINLRILERASQIPNLPDQTDAYIMTDAARNGGVRTCIKAAIYLTYVHPEDSIHRCDPDEDDSELTISEYIPANQQSIEDQLVYREMLKLVMDRVQQLSPEIQEVFVLSMNGMSDSQIATKLGVTRSAICQRRNRLSRHLALVLQ